MWFLQKPSQSQVQNLLLRLSQAPHNYPWVGATRGQLPKGFDIDRHEIFLGTGEAVFAKAKQAVSHLEFFNNPITQVLPPGIKAEAAQVVLVEVRLGAWWSLNPSRILYLVDTPDAYGFAYGTLKGHAESGEELFLLEQRSGGVYFCLLAFSRPAEWIARLGKPLVRILQRRASEQYLEAMKKAVEG